MGAMHICGGCGMTMAIGQVDPKSGLCKFCRWKRDEEKRKQEALNKAAEEMVR